MVKFQRRVRKRSKLDQKCLHLAIPAALLVGILVPFYLVEYLPAHSSGPSSSSLLLRRTTTRGLLPSLPTNAPGICVGTAADLPNEWQAPPSLQKDLDLQQDKLWTEEEQKLSDEASDKGLKELVDFYEEASDETILSLGTDAANSLVDCVYSSANLAEKHRNTAIQAAIRVLKISTHEYVGEESEDDDDTDASCEDSFNLMKFGGYAQYLLGEAPDDKELVKLRNLLRDRVNTAFKDCGTISGLLGFNVDEALAKPDPDPDDDLWEWMMQVIALVDSMTLPGVQVPKGTERFVADVWKCFGHYRFKNARDYPGEYNQAMAYLVTHVAYVPTGYGRHIQLLDDAPWLYRYIRENFYAAMETESSDLISEFVDLVRQYGCDEDNDVQVRDGARYLLKRFARRGYKWSRDDDEAGAYDIIHGPWTGLSGVERRVPEPIVPGSYGYIFYEILRKMDSTREKASTARE